MRFEQAKGLVLPRRYADAVIDDKTGDITRALIENYVGNFKEYYLQGLAPAFFGPPGVGKTHAAAVIAKLLDAKGVPVMWTSAVKMLNMLMDYRDFRKEEYFKLKAEVTETPVVVVDDFGHMQEFTRTKEMFFEIVDTRYSNKLPTIFTANYDVVGYSLSWSEMALKISPSIVRRVKAMSKGLLFVGGAGNVKGGEE